jgi:hypothetical protein
LTLKQLNPTTLLIRLEHIFQNNEDGTLSQPQTVDISEILPMFVIKSVQEMKLAANEYVQSQGIVRSKDEFLGTTPKFSAKSSFF